MKTHSATEYSDRLDKKLMEMEGKINKLKLKNVQSSQGSSSSSHKKDSKDLKEKNMVVPSSTSQQSNKSSINSTSHSVIGSIDLLKRKVHKSSFGDYSTTSYRLNE